MTDRALILTFHGIEAGPPPLSIDSALFSAQLDLLHECGAHVMTLGELARSLAEDSLLERTVAITFDDGLESVVDTAAPLLLDRGMRATVFCVAGRLGGDNQWPSGRSGTPRRALATAGALTELAGAGFEIGAHGTHHVPLSVASPAQLRQEIVDARHALEQQLGTTVSSFAYPYGAMPGAAGRALVRSTYSCACTARTGYASVTAERSELPRVDIHYLRRPALLRRAAEGTLGGYVTLRRHAAWARRLAVKDYSITAAR